MFYLPTGQQWGPLAGGTFERNLYQLISTPGIKSPGQDILGELGRADGGGQFIEVCARQVLEDVLDVPLPLTVDQRQDPPQQPEGIGAAGAPQVAYPEV